MSLNVNQLKIIYHKVIRHHGVSEIPKKKIMIKPVAKAHLNPILHICWHLLLTVYLFDKGLDRSDKMRPDNESRNTIYI